MSKTPTLKEVMAGYKKFNVWEVAEWKRTLCRLTVEESLAQYFELCEFAPSLSPEEKRIFLEQDKIHWIAMGNKHWQAAKVMGYAKETL